MTELILGGRFGEEPYDVSVRRLKAFVELGGSKVETAHSYANGEAERAVGRSLRHSGVKGHVAIISKFCHPDAEGKVDLTPTSFLRELRISLDRLEQNSIHVALLHRDDGRTDPADIVHGFREALDLGLTKRVGVANWTGRRLRELIRQAHLANLPRLVLSLQMSLARPIGSIWPGAISVTEEDLILARSGQVELYAWAANARGWFDSPLDPNVFDSLANRAVREVCREIAAKRGVRAQAIALAWLLRRPETSAITIGPANADEVISSMEASQIELDDGELSELTECSNWTRPNLSTKER